MRRQKQTTQKELTFLSVWPVSCCVGLDLGFKDHDRESDGNKNRCRMIIYPEYSSITIITNDKFCIFVVFINLMNFPLMLDGAKSGAAFYRFGWSKANKPIIRHLCLLWFTCPEMVWPTLNPSWTRNCDSPPTVRMTIASDDAQTVIGCTLPVRLVSVCPDRC